MPRSHEQPPDLPPNPPTQRQLAFMARNKLHPDRPIDFYDAMHTIGAFVRRRRELSPTAPQEKFLKEKGQWRDGMTRGEAFDAIKRIVADLGP
jgi:hypothetical protein